VTLHVSDEGSRADLNEILHAPKDDWHVYTCGPDRYMDGVIEAATAKGFAEENRHLEYFSVPEMPEYENHAYELRLAKSDRRLLVPADKSAAEVLQEAGFKIDIKCSDGICGVCKCDLISGDVEHRDFVLSKKQRETGMITCQSRAAEKDGVITLDL